MIKKLLKHVLLTSIIGLGIINFSEGWIYGQGTVGQQSTSEINNSYDIEITYQYDFLTTFLETTKRVLSFTNGQVFYRGLDGRLHFSGKSFDYDGIIDYFVLCDSLNGSTFNGDLRGKNCIRYNYQENISILNNLFYNMRTQDPFIYYYDNYYGDIWVALHGVDITSLGKLLIFPVGICLNSGYGCNFDLIGPFYDKNLIGSKSGDYYATGSNTNYSLYGLTGVKIGGYGNDFSTIPNSIIGVSPGYPSDDPEINDDVSGIALGSKESALNYFEDYYGRDSSICYAGVNNVSTMYGTNGVSFQEGTGLNIFQVYSGIYNTIPDLDKVYVWLNSWLLNYEQWFDRDGDPLFLSNYNTGTNSVDIYYDNLTFPFLNNPVAVYFLASNIESKSPYSTMGSEIVSYCNIKLNNGTFDEIIDQAVKNNITGYTEQSNKNIGLNPDGTRIVIDFSNFGQYTGDAWITSGSDLAFSGDTSIRNVLREFFNFGSEIVDYTGSNSQVRNTRTTTNPILPSYIIIGLLFVLLFKFLRRR